MGKHMKKPTLPAETPAGGLPQAHRQLQAKYIQLEADNAELLRLYYALSWFQYYRIPLMLYQEDDTNCWVVAGSSENGVVFGSGESAEDALLEAFTKHGKGECQSDGICYTSDPPKLKCKVCGKFWEQARITPICKGGEE